jgi:hypothetical protein
MIVGVIVGVGTAFAKLLMNDRPAAEQITTDTSTMPNNISHSRQFNSVCPGRGRIETVDLSLDVCTCDI